MNKLSLSKRADKAFPETIMAEGRAFSIHADFRVILKIFRLLGDPEIAEQHKNELALRWFYCDEIPKNGAKLLLTFLGADEPAAEEEQVFDFEFDAPEIYASFLQQYGIDLIDVPFLHWYRFCALLSGLSDDTSFRRKIELRFLDTGLCKNKQKAEAAKRTVQIPKAHSVTEASYIAQLSKMLSAGEDISEFIRG